LRWFGFGGLAARVIADHDAGLRGSCHGFLWRYPRGVTWWTCSGCGFLADWTKKTRSGSQAGFLWPTDLL
jgi:hypothetical protein